MTRPAYLPPRPVHLLKPLSTVRTCCGLGPDSLPNIEFTDDPREASCKTCLYANEGTAWGRAAVAAPAFAPGRWHGRFSKSGPPRRAMTVTTAGLTAEEAQVFVDLILEHCPPQWLGLANGSPLYSAQLELETE